MLPNQILWCELIFSFIVTLGNPKPWPTVGHNIVELTPENWEEVVFSPKHDVVVEFYSPCMSL
jgi:hypothetical protein